jgi:hypothetical protein
MTKFLGRLAKFGLTKENVRGVAENTADVFVPHINIELNDEVETIIDESSVGILEDSISSNISKKFSTGSFEGKAGDQSIGYFLLALLGQVNSEDNTDGTYKHKFSILQNSQHPSLTLFLSDPVQAYKYSNAMLSNLDFNIQLGQYFLISGNFRSKSGQETSLTPAYTEENNFLPQDCEIKFANNISELDSANSVSARSVSLSIKKAIEDHQSIGDVELKDISNGIMEITGSIEIVYDSKNFREDFVNDKEKAIRITAKNSNKIIGDSKNPEITINLNKTKITSFKKNYDNTAITTANLEFKAFFKILEGCAVKVEVVNEKEGY